MEPEFGDPDNPLLMKKFGIEPDPSGKDKIQEDKKIHDVYEERMKALKNPTKLLF